MEAALFPFIFDIASPFLAKVADDLGKQVFQVVSRPWVICAVTYIFIVCYVECCAELVC